MERQIKRIISSSIYGIGASDPQEEKPKELMLYKTVIFCTKIR